MISIMEAARHFVYLSYQEDCNSLTPLKLQKILYLAQGWSYVWDDKPLFLGNFEAWQYGPVNSEVYYHFKKYGSDEIPKEEGAFCLRDRECRATIEAVWKEYGRYSAFALVNITHEQTPWKKAYETDSLIKNSDIRDYFQSTY